jgi:uncharacterized phage protein gp47/JayE
MSYFAPYIDATGIHVPEYIDIRDKLLGDYRRIMGTDENGEDIYLGEDTQDYQFISIVSLALNDSMAALADCYNIRNPDYAYGASLDYILPVNGIKRNLATSSKATLVITGQIGASLPANLQAKDQSGYVWRIPAAFTIGSDGTAQVSAVCITAGAIQADAGTITLINTPTAYWYSVTNPLPASPGQALETDAAAKSRRAISIGLPSRSVLDGLIAALQNVSGIGRQKVIENDNDETDARGIPGHSICAVAEGGSDTDIAQVILLKKGPGSGTYGDQDVTVQDGYGNPKTVRFFRPVQASIYPTITVKALSGWDAFMIDAIKAALSSYAKTVEIGGTYNVSYLWSLAFSASGSGIPAFSVQSVVAKKGAAGSNVASEILLGFNEIAICAPTNVTVTVV